MDLKSICLSVIGTYSFTGKAEQQRREHSDPRGSGEFVGHVRCASSNIFYNISLT